MDSVERCPKCGYLLYAAKFPLRCSECGESLAEQLLNNLLPWETHGVRSSLWGVLATVAFVVGSPTELLRRLQRRSEYGVVRAKKLVVCIAMAYLLEAIVSGCTLRISGSVVYAFSWGPPLSYVFSRAPADCCIWASRFFRDDCVPWMGLWIGGSAVVWIVARRHSGIHSVWSIASVLGAVPLLGATARCTTTVLQLLLSPEAMPLVPIFRWIGATVLLLMLTTYGYFIARIRAT